MIRFEHVTRRYEPDGRPALDDVTVEFNRGDFVFLIGASGSGKSTLLRMILREGLPQRGKVTVAGQNLGLMLERRVPDYRRSIGMVFQDFRLLPDKTVFDNVAFAMRVIGARRTQIRERVTEVLERVGLEDLARRYPHEISGGEQQRAAIARAIVNEPAIVLADEPTGNLDPRASDEVMKILRWINASGTTVIMATHDRVIVDRMRRRVVQLHDGALVRDDERGTYDPPRGSQAWTVLRERESSGALRVQDPRAHDLGEQGDGGATAPGPEALTADAARAAGRDVPVAAEAVEHAARAQGSASAEEGPTAEHSAPDGTAADTASPQSLAEPVRVRWPEHLRPQQHGPDVPEPVGGFDGSEMPNLARDGYTEPEGEGADPERLRDALRQAVSSHVQMSAGPDGVAEHPHESWFTHAAPGLVDRPGSAATPAAPGSAKARGDEIEDERLRTQSGDDEPPVHDPDLPLTRGQGPRRRAPVPASPAEAEAPADRDDGGLARPLPAVTAATPAEPGAADVPEVLEDLAEPDRESESSDAPQPEPQPEPPSEQVRELDSEAESEHSSARSAPLEAEEGEPPILDDRPPRPVDVDGEEVEDLTEGVPTQVHPGAPDSVDPDSPDQDSAGESAASGRSASSSVETVDADSVEAGEASPQVPRPRSSASQSTYADTRRTAEQLGVTGERRSFWRRLRRRR
ncbi:cell division ATP-binding protein FtsE [Nesterenkonia sp. PF2B19]|uniref:cell division ATP-binding protein FtsE n=1 Tax=unclassified Nesterenkonia TaxID=2629769 RepID=UPI00111C3121|nr:cell division ATP-binding protein FtsE [Nesterenkonia sp. PF2B19]